ncbi:sulfate transporter [Serinibacter arcticus]|uniref:Sulfate transporter n=1 Tax=Serinibacter arcticus TaxID=1655435 RepID=A0A2U1ZXH3_9MICO|nr:STAS domain-containing protein [Serinibacter arcticus]PWD51688.1 sulfate transporter [Serinibacter arcticus]
MDDAGLIARPVVDVSQDGRGTFITLTGEIDVSASGDLADAVAQAEKASRRTSVDASGITFMDSSGIALLARLATRTPGPLRVIDPPEVVRFLLDVTRIGDMVEIVEGGAPDPDTEPFSAA